jgi:hypothetical protein
MGGQKHRIVCVSTELAPVATAYMWKGSDTATTTQIAIGGWGTVTTSLLATHQTPHHCRSDTCSALPLLLLAYATAAMKLTPHSKLLARERIKFNYLRFVIASVGRTGRGGGCCLAGRGT